MQGCRREGSSARSGPVRRHRARCTTAGDGRGTTVSDRSWRNDRDRSAQLAERRRRCRRGSLMGALGAVSGANGGAQTGHGGGGGGGSSGGHAGRRSGLVAFTLNAIGAGTDRRRARASWQAWPYATHSACGRSSTTPWAAASLRPRFASSSDLRIEPLLSASTADVCCGGDVCQQNAGPTFRLLRGGHVHVASMDSA